ncbi:MAG: alpha-glucosidase [Clostridiales bacterium]|nr:alpha-glucosidase [Roseburia sp.]MDD7636721.1 alpha-glucosidase [Clostridiales bacterium]MDY4111702.1 alpha-glucosidase [Roseburia sp.]
MERKWWKECVIYQLYPRSFFDANHDGIGDIRGIIEKLDYLKELGIGAIWLNPIYASPNDDMGYDISDYQSIMKEFGTMEDFDELLARAHEKGIRIIMDLVVNHSSDEHAWFIQSRKSKDNPYRDFYIWREGKDGKEPNNWASFFTPSAWKLDEETGEYYLHLFSEKQPDLNWENPKLREHIYEMINWWLDKGVDGFRMDVINLIAKRQGLPDGSGEKNLSGYVFCPENFANQERLGEYLKEMRRKCFDGRDCMCVGETPFVNPETGRKYIDPKEKELDMIFQFELMDIDSGKSGKWEMIPYDLSKFKSILHKWQDATQEGWGSLFWSNHDQPRPLSRFVNVTSEEMRIRAAKMLATAMHLLRGTSFIYQGEEIGMMNASFTSLSQLRDIESIEYYNAAKKAGRADEAWAAILRKGRDNARTPMQWDDSVHAGFSDHEPWLMVNENYRNINVAKAREDKESIWYYYQKLIRFKSSDETAIYGAFEELCPEHPEVFSYRRSLEENAYVVICNFSADKVSFDMSGYKKKELLFHNCENESEDVLLGYEARVIKI